MFSMNNAEKIPSGVWAIGFVSLFMDASSELVHSLLPALFVSLGISMTAVGVIEGMADAIASISKLFSGTLSDWLGKRKILTIIGYGLETVTSHYFHRLKPRKCCFWRGLSTG
jgi:MFS family permease